jgi:hypothetical protein
MAAGGGRVDKLGSTTVVRLSSVADVVAVSATAVFTTDGETLFRPLRLSTNKIYWNNYCKLENIR